MPTVLRPAALRPTPTRQGRASHHRWLRPAAIVLSGAMLGVGAWLLTARSTGSTGTRTTTPPAVAQTAGDLTRSLDITALQRQLVDAGYAIRVTAALDPLTRAAAADFFGSAGRPVAAPLAHMVAGTIFLGKGDPADWNARFGLDRRTRLVERALIGPAGQLDAYGNLR